MDTKYNIFGKIPIRVSKDKRLTLNDIRVYGALSSFQGNNDSCFPSLDKISERSGVHKSHISKHTRRLEECGYILKIRCGKRINNRYIVNNDLLCEESSKKTIDDHKRGDYAKSDESLDNIDCTITGEYAGAAKSDYAESAESDYAESAESNIKRTDKRTMKRTEYFKIQIFIDYWEGEYERIIRKPYQSPPNDTSLVEKILAEGQDIFTKVTNYLHSSRDNHTIEEFYHLWVDRGAPAAEDTSQ
jgi:DNA-binding transcriptional ArsR family regulator